MDGKMDHLPYHLASSTSAGETAEGFGLGAGFFLEKRATVLNVAGVDAAGEADLVAPLKLRGFPSISDTPREAAALDAAREAISLCCKAFCLSSCSGASVDWIIR
jgi:hypothetical protein